MRYATTALLLLSLLLLLLTVVVVDAPHCYVAHSRRGSSLTRPGGERGVYIMKRDKRSESALSPEN